MGKSVTAKIIEQHLVAGEMRPGEEIGLRIDQCLTQDATGTMAYLQFEAMGLPRIKAELAVSYVDHNTLQSDHLNFDDHRYLQTVAAKFGAYFSRPGNGICHQVHLERFGVPGKTLLGSDSHTPTGGGLGMLAIGAGGLDVAVAMGGGPFYTVMPKIVRVELLGHLGPWVTAKDVILEMLRRLTVKGGVGKVFEYTGPGAATLSVPERATITNMGAELGATSSVFPSDDVTRQYLRYQGREQDWRELLPDDDAEYDEEMELDLSKLEPLIALADSPDNVKPVSAVAGSPVDQVLVGSCTNSSYADLALVAAALRGKKVHPWVSFGINPGSRQTFEMIARTGELADLISAGARILECTCGPCIGMGQAPPSGSVSLRSYNRNFAGRSGTKDAQVHLASPATCVAAAIQGVITDPRDLGQQPAIKQPEKAIIDDSMILPPAEDPASVTIVRGPNIKPVPLKDPLPDTVRARVLLKVGDNITTDHIMPAGASLLPLRSNVPALAEHVFERVDPEFAARAKAAGTGVVVGGANYGQGSSREHAAIAPMFLGVQAVLATSFARIHKANLINFGILPLQIAEADYAALEQGDELELVDVRNAVEARKPVRIVNKTRGTEFAGDAQLSQRQSAIILAGGLLNYTREQAT